jgi:hypothetical protein
VPRAEVGGPNSKHLKFPKSVCQPCNNALTAPYDRAWDTLYNYLQSKWARIVRLGRFDLRAVFANFQESDARHVQLYFAKVFGCVVYEQQAPIELSRLARCIQYDTACPEIVLGVCHDDQSPKGRKVAHISPIHVWGDEHDNDMEGAVWMCGQSPVTMKVFYRRHDSKLRPIDETWHPLDGRTRVLVNKRL